MTELSDAAKHALAKAQKAVGGAIAEVKNFQGHAGSPEIHSAHNALDHLGMAYMHLSPPRKGEQNPAWTSDPGAAMG